MNLKQYPEALKYLDEGLALTPKTLALIALKADLLATCPDAKYRDGEQAQGLARACCALTSNKNPEFLRILASAYAECGEYEQATSTVKKAIKAASSDEYVLKALTEDLKLYEASKPLRKE